jgi:hypothetical protein
MTTGVGGCGGGCGNAAWAVVPARRVLDRLSPTPAQAADIAHRDGTYQDWVTDVPVQGPTDPGIRAAGCWWKENVLDKVTDRQGAIVPRWTQSSTLCMAGRPVRTGVAGLGETIQMHLGPNPTLTPKPSAGSPTSGTASSPPGVWSKLAATESQWVMNTLTQLNALILKAGNKPCATWPADPTKNQSAAVACFQGWFNANGKPAEPLRTDGTLDEASLCALVAVTKQHAGDFTVQYPGSPSCGGGLSTLAKVGIGVGALVVVGGTIAAVAAHGKKKTRTPPAASPQG